MRLKNKMLYLMEFIKNVLKIKCYRGKVIGKFLINKNKILKEILREVERPKMYFERYLLNMKLKKKK